MDEIDRRLIYYLLKDGKISQNRLAKLLNISSPSLNVRFRKLIEEGIIRSFKLFVNPNIYGKYFMYVAFPNLKDIEDDRVFVKFKCMENFNVYGIEGENLSEIERFVKEVSLVLGKPIMKYIPSQNISKPRKEVVEVLQILSKNPRAKEREIALKLNYKPKKVIKILSNLKEMVKIVPEVDLTKANSLILGVFTKRLEDIKKFTGECSIITVRDREGEGVEICFTGDIKESKKVVDEVRKIDPYSHIMLVYDYEIRGIKVFSS